MVAIENEYGGNMEINHVCDHNYTYFLRDLFWSILGNDVVLYTTDSADSPPAIQCGHVNGTFTTVDFDTDNLDYQTIVNHFKLQQSFNPDNGGPGVDSEYYDGWIVNWGSSYYSIFHQIQRVINDFTGMYSLNASWSVYMFHGGTNFGFQNAWNVITSYDYAAPISENGDVTPLYVAIRNMIQNFTDWDTPPQAIPQNNTKVNYGTVALQRVGTNLISTLTQILESCTTSTYPMTFEQINHGYGFVLYTTTLQKSGKTLSIPGIRDYGYVFLNNVYQ
uniref:Glycoside hydrolase 35 catalytic domain-containing protein n=1 Tax=Acrobeloides nanus TaxID=290746 RepID=A0A914E5U3_9BILA